MEEEGLITKETIFYDVFGGSGLLSHTLKQLFPNHKVIWNDYDNYLSRLSKAKECEILRKELLEFIAPLAKYGEKLSQEARLKVHKFLKEKANKTYIDWILLSAYLCFSGRNACDEKSFYKQNSLWHNINQSQEIKTKGYLKGVLRVRMDYKALMNLAYYGSEEELNKISYLVDEEFKEKLTEENHSPVTAKGLSLEAVPLNSNANSSGEITSALQPRNDSSCNKNAFLILDPPYFNTETFHYEGKKWTLEDFLYIMFFVKKPFITFGSGKSGIADFMKFSDTYLNLSHLKECQFLENQTSFRKVLDKREFMFFSKLKTLF